MASPLGGATPRARRRPRWLAIAFVLLLVVPIVEVAAIIAVGRVIGAWPTVLLLLLESALGAWLVRREGGRAWAALDEALRTGRMPSRQLADAALVLVGGTLLLTPGFVTDLVGFFFILPLTRPIARRVLEAAVSRRLLASPIVRAARAASGGAGSSRAGAPDVVAGEVVDPEPDSPSSPR